MTGKTKISLEELKRLIEKAEFILGEVIEEYDSAKEPDLMKALTFIKGEDNSEEAMQSFKWICEYPEIMTSLQIVFDYVLQAKEGLNELQAG